MLVGEHRPRALDVFLRRQPDGRHSDEQPAEEPERVRVDDQQGSGYREGERRAARRGSRTGPRRRRPARPPPCSPPSRRSPQRSPSRGGRRSRSRPSARPSREARRSRRCGATSGVAPTFSSCPMVIRASTAPIANPRTATTGSVSTPACWSRCGKRVRSRRVRPISMRTQASTVEPKKSSFAPSERNEWMVHQPTLSVHGSRPRAALRLSRGDRSSSARCAPPSRTAPCRASASSRLASFGRPEVSSPTSRSAQESWTLARNTTRLVSQRPTAAASRRRLRGGGDASRALSPPPPGGARHAGSRSLTGGRLPRRRRERRIPSWSCVVHSFGTAGEGAPHGRRPRDDIPDLLARSARRRPLG